MISFLKPGKILLATLALSAAAATVQPASAQPYPFYPRHERFHREFRPVPACVTRRVVVRTPYGPRVVLRRFCR